MTRLTLARGDGTVVALCQIVRNAVKQDPMEAVLERIEWLPDREFHQFEYGLVAYYRRHEVEQERIALALQRRTMAPLSMRSRARVDEIMAMLDHVHDPLIR